jgi:hypothetical protein
MVRIGTGLIWIPALVWEQKVPLRNLSSRKIFKIGSILKQPLLDRRCLYSHHIPDFGLAELRSMSLPLALVKTNWQVPQRDQATMPIGRPDSVRPKFLQLRYLCIKARHSYIGPDTPDSETRDCHDACLVACYQLCEHPQPFPDSRESQSSCGDRNAGGLAYRSSVARFLFYFSRSKVRFPPQY